MSLVEALVVASGGVALAVVGLVIVDDAPVVAVGVVLALAGVSQLASAACSLARTAEAWRDATPPRP